MIDLVIWVGMEETKEAVSNRIALIDADFLPFFCCHCKKLENGELEVKTLEDCIYLVDKFIANILEAVKATHCVLAITNKKCFRYQIYEDYKANRKYGEPLLYFEETRDYLINKTNVIKDTLTEADDIVVCFRNYLNNLEIDNIIVALDKDIINCTAGEFYNPKKGEFLTTSKEEANKNFKYSLITGDSVDNIKGIPGKGIKFAEQYLQDAENCTGDILDAYIDHFGEDEGIEQFYLNYKMLKILDKPAYGFNPADYELDTFKI